MAITNEKIWLSQMKKPIMDRWSRLIARRFPNSLDAARYEFLCAKRELRKEIREKLKIIINFIEKYGYKQS